ncbi:MAG: hypothetical protein KF723_15140 [Rhizobiaceae bacterium]|nr:hypothetical protein [Rhizobiaceae bacterium]
MPAIDVERITTEECARRLSRRLRQLIGPGRVWSYRGVSNLSGIDERTLKAYCAGTACPNLTKFHRLLAVLGPAITVDLQLMLGWTPRSGLRLPPGAVDLEAVAKDLRELMRVIDAEMGKTDAAKGRRLGARDRP